VWVVVCVCVCGGGGWFAHFYADLFDTHVSCHLYLSPNRVCSPSFLSIIIIIIIIRGRV